MNCFCVVVIPNKLELTDNVPQISLEKATDRQVIMKWINYDTWQGKKKNDSFDCLAAAIRNYNSTTIKRKSVGLLVK